MEPSLRFRAWGLVSDSEPGAWSQTRTMGPGLRLRPWGLVSDSDHGAWSQTQTMGPGLFPLLGSLSLASPLHVVSITQTPNPLYGDLLYGDLLYGDLLYGDPLYGDPLYGDLLHGNMYMRRSLRLTIIAVLKAGCKHACPR